MDTGDAVAYGITFVAIIGVCLLVGWILFSGPITGEGVVTSISTTNDCFLGRCVDTVYFGDSNSLQCSPQSVASLTLGEQVQYLKPSTVSTGCVFTPLK
jgi:hypothetical protein